MVCNKVQELRNEINPLLFLLTNFSIKKVSVKKSLSLFFIRYRYPRFYNPSLSQPCVNRKQSVRTFVNCRYIFGTKIQDSCKTHKTLSELNKTNSMNSIFSTISFFQLNIITSNFF